MSPPPATAWTALGGDRADATTDGGAEQPANAEPDLRDAAAGPRQVDLNSAA